MLVIFISTLVFIQTKYFFTNYVGKTLFHYILNIGALLHLLDDNLYLETQVSNKVNVNVRSKKIVIYGRKRI